MFCYTDVSDETRECGTTSFYHFELRDLREAKKPPLFWFGNGCQELLEV